MRKLLDCLCSSRSRRTFIMFSSFHVFATRFYVYMDFSRANAVDIAQFDTCITSRDIFFICRQLSLSFSVSLKCLNRFPRKKEASLFEQRAAIYAFALFAAAVDAIAPSVARNNDCDASALDSRAMILNDDEKTKKCAQFVIKKFIDCSQGISSSYRATTGSRT